eukprot:2878488-Amphidinium_carterae.1
MVLQHFVPCTGSRRRIGARSHCQPCGESIPRHGPGGKKEGDDCSINVVVQIQKPNPHEP